MPNKAIVMFDPDCQEYIVKVKKPTWIPFVSVWAPVLNTSYDRPTVRKFSTYEKAKIFAMKCSIEVLVQHKHDVDITNDRL